MSKIAFIYPGQGAQKAGMGADFYENSEIARYIFDQAGEELDLDMKELCFEENDRLDLTEYTQAAMVTTCLAMTRVAESKGLKADITSGLSLGEYPAIAAAGGMNDMDAIRLVRKRGILMQNTVPAGEGAMCAVISMAAEEIEKVIEPIADVRDNIVDFKDGYETVLGERGVTVSGGQKQRISIARALLKNAPILILDDSVSAVDTRTEKIILDNLKTSRAGKTTLLIAHRISTVEQLDKIVFIEDGRVEAVGPHDELYRSCAEYRRMVDLQKLEDEEGGGSHG